MKIIKKVNNIERYDIKPIYMAIGRSFPADADFFINLGRFSMIACFQSNGNGDADVKNFLTKHLGNYDPCVNKWLNTITLIQSNNRSSSDINYVLTTLEFRS